MRWCSTFHWPSSARARATSWCRRIAGTGPSRAHRGRRLRRDLHQPGLHSQQDPGAHGRRGRPGPARARVRHRRRGDQRGLAGHQGPDVRQIDRISAEGRQRPGRVGRVTLFEGRARFAGPHELVIDDRHPHHRRPDRGGDRGRPAVPPVIADAGVEVPHLRHDHAYRRAARQHGHRGRRLRRGRVRPHLLRPGRRRPPGQPGGPGCSSPSTPTSPSASPRWPGSAGTSTCRPRSPVVHGRDRAAGRGPSSARGRHRRWPGTCCWSPPGASRTPMTWAWTSPGSRLRTTGASRSTSTGGRRPRGSGRSATSARRSSSSTWPTPRPERWPITWPTPMTCARTRTTGCPRRCSPSRRSPRSAPACRTWTGKRPYVQATQAYDDTAYGWALQDTSGVCRLYADPATGKLLGAHILGYQASLLIQPLVQAASFGLGVAEHGPGPVLDPPGARRGRGKRPAQAAARRDRQPRAVTPGARFVPASGRESWGHGTSRFTPARPDRHGGSR